MKKNNLITLFLIFSLALAPINAIADENDVEQAFTSSANSVELGNFAKITPLEDDGIQAKSERQNLLSTLSNDIDSNNSIALTVGSSGEGESGSYNGTFVIDQPSGYYIDTSLNQNYLPFIYLIDPNETQQLNCTVINSVLQRGTCVNSTKLDSTALDSNNLNSYIDSSYESFCDATLATLTLTDCINSSLTETNTYNSTINLSISDLSTVDNSIISSSNFTLSIILDSTIINSTLSECNVTDSFVSQTDCTLSEIINSTIDCPNRINIENGVLLDNILQSGAIHYGGLTYGTGANVGEICSTAPKINIITPIAGQVVGNMTNVIVNTSANNTPQLFIRNEPTGRNMTFNYSSIWYYSWNTYEYPDGDTNIKAKDFDYYGNPGEDSRDVIVDNTPPVITITSPTEMITALQNIVLSGSIIDQTTYVREANYSILNETGSITESGPLTLTGNSFSKQVTLSEFQNNTIIVCAVDHENVNNSACLQKNITQNTGAPFAEILAPPNNTITDLPNINVTTNVSNAVVAYLFVNGIALTSPIEKNGTGIYQASLTQGLNQLQIQAIGETGVSGFSEIVNVYYRPELPPSIGDFISNLNLVRNGTTVEFSFQGASLDYNVTVFTILLNDNIPTLDLNYVGNGWYNNSMLVNSSQPDGPKTIFMNASINSSYNYTASVVITLDNTPPVGSIKINNDDEQTSNVLVDLQMVYLDNYGVKECRLSNYPFESESSGQSFSFSEDFADEDNIDLNLTADINAKIIPGTGVQLYEEQILLQSAMINTNIYTLQVNYHDYMNATLFNDTFEFKFVDTSNVTDATFCIESSSENISSPLDFYIYNGSNFTLKTSYSFSAAPSLYCFSLVEDELNKSAGSEFIVKANHSDNVSVEYINHIYLINQTNSTTRYQAQNNITSKTVVTTLLDISTATMFAEYDIPTQDYLQDKLNSTLNETNMSDNDSVTIEIPRSATILDAEFDIQGINLTNATLKILNTTIWSVNGTFNSQATLQNIEDEISDFIDNNCSADNCTIPVTLSAENGSLEIGNLSILYSLDIGIIKFFMASDGINFEQVISDEPHTFSNIGKTLKWKAVIQTSNNTLTPTLTSVDILSSGTPWEPCTSQKVWKLIDTAIGIEERTVYYQIKDNVGWITDVNDTILLNKTSEILDWTAPVNLTIWVDEWTNSEDTLEARWRAFDRESKVFYQYRIYHEGSQIYPSSGWLDAPDYGQAEFVSVNLSEEIDHTLGDGDRYYFEVRALNSYYINSSPVMSDPIGVDRDPPEMPENLVSSFILNGCVNTSIGNFEWEEPDDNGDSGIRGYSYIITTDINATPDETPEGDPYNLDQFLSLNVSGLSDNLYYFKVRAVDNAGNGGDTANWTFHVDTIRPGPPQIEDYEQYANLSSLNLDWIASQDGRGCGIDYYKVMVYNDSDLSIFEKDQSTSDNSTSLTITGLAQEETYYFVIYAYDNAGWESLPSSVMQGGIDTTNPTIIWIKPIGLIATLTPTIAYTTSEDAECWLNGTYAMYHSNSTYHERRGPPLGGPGSLYAECFDIPVRNPGHNQPGEQYTVDLNANVSSVIIDSDNPFYIGEEVIIDATLKSGGSPIPIGEIKKSRVEVFFDGKPLDEFGWSDKGAGEYQITFDSPLAEGIYNITVKVDGSISNLHQINITELLLTMTYTSDFTDSSDNIIYSDIGNHTIGFASDSSKVVSDGDTMNAGTSDGVSYIFVTKKGSNLKQRNAYLRDKEFSDFINPSFGYEIEKEMYVLNTQLAYDDIVIQGAREQVPSGRYNLIIRNLGLDEDGNTIIEVDIT
ncbi:MAG: fibronectin type III domain-containing protein [Candidatus Woesearchaeota archaeon]